MLEEQSNTALQEINEKNIYSRFDELVEQYGDVIKATVHRVLEDYIHKSFKEFMGDRIGIEFIRVRDGKKIMDYCNGYRTVKQLTIDTQVLENFKIPRNRVGGFKSDIISRTRRRAGKFAGLALELFVNGVSTRKVRRAFNRAGIKISGLSKSTVSSITKDLLQEYLTWINRPIIHKFKYLQADAVYVKVRKNSKKRVGTLIIIGICEDGYKEVLHFTVGTESETNFDEVLQSLIRRGLDIDSVELITLDGAKGPINSARSHFGENRLQRCLFHKNQNILNKTPKNLRDEFKAKLNRLWNMPTRLEAEEYLKRIKEEYYNIARNAVECLFEDKNDLLRYYSFPENHRKAIRTTNLIERVIREVRRRTKVMDTLDNEYGCYGILMGVVREQNERWSRKSHWKKK